MEIVRETELGIGTMRRGKVRDCYELGPNLLLVASDRISAFDVVMPGGIPDKGRVLNGLSAFWFERTAHLIDNHVITTDIDRIIELEPALSGHRDRLRGRVTLGRRTSALPVECVVRGYLAGSAWHEYKAHGTVAGQAMPGGMMLSQRLDTPQFTPAIKAESGHDENISVERMKGIIGAELADQVIRTSLALFEFATEYLDRRGMLLADTKFEFGLLDGRLILIDEIFTPDSSRFWLAEDYEPGKNQQGFDKQPLRDWLEQLVAEGRWDKTPPGPELPERVVSFMSQLYRKTFQLITGEELR